MPLSKPIMSYGSMSTRIINDLLITYFDCLYTHPIKTKAITSSGLAILADLVAQKLSGVKRISEDRLIAFGLFGLIFGGPTPHYFFYYAKSMVKDPSIMFLIERFLFTPWFQALTLYMLERFEGKSHQTSYEQLYKLYKPIMIANLKYLSILQFIQMKYVPPLLRILISNVINFIWTLYLAIQRKKTTTKK